MLEKKSSENTTIQSSSCNDCIFFIYSPHGSQDLHNLSEFTERFPHQTHPVNDVVSVGLTSL